MNNADFADFVFDLATDLAVTMSPMHIRELLPMKSLPEIQHDNHRMTNRDFGSLCNWFVFLDGDFVGAFVEKQFAEVFANHLEYDFSGPDRITITQAKP